MSDAPAPLRVALVDNDRTVTDLLALDLRLEGHDVVGTAADATGCMAICAQARPDVLVIDMKLGPGPDGLDLVGQVVPRPPRTILYTNYVTAEVLRRADALGAVVVEKGSLGALRRAVAG